MDATQAAFFVQTEIARPLSTPTLSSSITPASFATPTLIRPNVTPSPAAGGTLVGETQVSQTPTLGSTSDISGIRVTALPGLEIYTNPDILDYVFQIDPSRWEKDPSGKTANLVHKENANCRIESVPGHGLGPPKRLLWQDFGRFRWQILDYGPNAYVVPVGGSGLSDQGSSFLQLQGYSQPACRTDQEVILANLMPKSEALGQIPLSLFLSPTPRPALEGFSCPNTPSARLRVGDEVSVVTDGLWLRSVPQADESSKIRKFLRYAPVMIQIVGGPACEKYVYWQVEVSTIGEVSETTKGWLAEGDSQEIYLMPVK